MKRSFVLRNLDCANCAAKMEKAIRKIHGVETATVSFMTQKLTLEADEALFCEILEEAQRACAKFEPDCTMVR